MTRAFGLAVLLLLGWTASADELSDAKALADVGRAAYDQERYDDAVEAYTAAYRRYPAPLMLFDIAQAYRMKGDRRRAIQYYEDYLRLEPNGRGSAEARLQIPQLVTELNRENTRESPKVAPVEQDETDRRAEPTRKQKGESQAQRAPVLSEFHQETELPRTPKPTSPLRRIQFFLSTMVGAGLASVSAGATTEIAYQFQTQGANAGTYVQQPVGSSGVSYLPLLTNLEVGLRIKSAFTSSLVLRFEFLPNANAQTVRTGMEQAPTTKAFGAISVLARFGYLFLKGRAHPFLHGDIGGGEMRTTLDISGAEIDQHPLVDKFTAETWNGGTHDPNAVQEVCANRRDCVDTVLLGAFFVGGGFGVWVDLGATGTLGSHFAFVVDNLLLAAVRTGRGNSAFVTDLTLGLAASF